MLSVCFDASGTDHDQPAVVVAGFISSAKDWVLFNNKWKERLNRDGVSCFHMVEFAGSKGEFTEWKEDRRRELLADLMSIIQSYTYEKFGCAVLNEAFRSEIPEDIRDEFRFTAYSLAARACVSNVTRWFTAENWNTNTLEYVFEDGDLGKGMLQDIFKRDGYPSPIFKPKKDRPTPLGGVESGWTPLQAADFLAYEFLLSIKHAECGRLKDKPLRWAMGEFLKSDSRLNLRTFLAKDLAHLRELIELSKEQFGEVMFYH